jgi:adenine phosphoribosyltransferase
MKTGHLKEGQRVLIHDDLLATGGTTEAAAKLISKQGAIPTQFSFLIDLKDLNGRERLEKFNAEVYSILEY